MASLDTNVLVRFLVRDDNAQYESACALLRSAVDADEPLFVPVSVTLELEWVLRSRFRFDKAAFELILSRLLDAEELLFESETAIESALSLYQQDNADFADALHAALAHTAGQTPLWTFDKAAAQLAGARLLSNA